MTAATQGCAFLTTRNALSALIKMTRLWPLSGTALSESDQRRMDRARRWRAAALEGSTSFVCVSDSPADVSAAAWSVTEQGTNIRLESPSQAGP
jgi:hypothetical protein